MKNSWENKKQKQKAKGKTKKPKKASRFFKMY